MLCNTPLEFIHLVIESLPPLTNISLISSDPLNYYSMFSCVSLNLLDSTYKWYHAMFVYVWLILPSIIPSKFIHIITNDRYIFLKDEYAIVYVSCVYVCVCVCVERERERQNTLFF